MALRLGFIETLGFPGLPLFPQSYHYTIYMTLRRLLISLWEAVRTFLSKSKFFGQLMWSLSSVNCLALDMPLTRFVGFMTCLTLTLLIQVINQLDLVFLIVWHQELVWLQLVEQRMENKDAVKYRIYIWWAFHETLPTCGSFIKRHVNYPS